MDWAKPYIARVAASLVAGLVAWLASKYGVIVPDEAKGQLTQAAVAVMMVVWGIVYAITHKAVNTKVNPTDAAKPSDAGKK